MSETPPFVTIRQGDSAPAQAPQAQGNSIPMSQATVPEAVPRARMHNPEHQQYPLHPHGQHPPLHPPGYQQPQYEQPQYQQPRHQQSYHAGVSRHSDISSQWNPDEPREHRASIKSGIRHEGMTEAAMREFLSDYAIYRFEKKYGEYDVEEEGLVPQPTWENVDCTEVRDISKKLATRRVQKLCYEKSVQEKMADLILAQRQHLEDFLDKLAKAERDTRYCYVLEQLDRQTERITDDEYVRDYRNWDRLTKKEKEKAKYYRAKGGKKVVVSGPLKSLLKEKERKSGQKKVTTSITAYYKRTPRRGEDIVAMYQDRLTRVGEASHQQEDAERTYNQPHHESFSYSQQVQGRQQHHGVDYSQQHQQHHTSQVFQQPHYPQQQPQQHQQYLPQQQSQQHQQYPPQQQPQHESDHNPHYAEKYLQPTHLPIRTKTNPAAVPTGQYQPVVVHQDPGPKVKNERKSVEVIHTGRTTKKNNRRREKRYRNASARSSWFSSSEDTDSIDTKTTPSSSAPSDPSGHKRGRTKRRSKGTRGRSESAGRSRSRSRPGFMHRPEYYGVTRRHVLDDYARYGSPSVGGELAVSHHQNLAVAVPPAEPGISPAELKTFVDVIEKIQGQKGAGPRLPEEQMLPRTLDATRPVTWGREEDEVWTGDRFYNRREYERHEGQDARAYSKVYQPVDRAHHRSDSVPSRASGEEYYPVRVQVNKSQYRPSPAQVPQRQYVQASDDIPDDHEYIYIATPRTRPQSPERKDYGHDVFRRPRYADEETYVSSGREQEEDYVSGLPRGRKEPYMRGRSHERERPYMSGGIHHREEARPNPFNPRPRYD